MSIRSVVVVLIAVLATGCAQQLPPLNFNPPNVGISETKVLAELRSITVSVARPDEQTGEIDFILAESGGTRLTTGGGIADMWKGALEESLLRMAVFQDGSDKTVSVSVKVLKLDVPSAGFDFTTPVEARYEIIDRNSGGIIYTQNIASEGTTPADYAFVGAIRARESINRAVQNNITLFLQALQSVDLDKPMFPASATKTPGV